MLTVSTGKLGAANLAFCPMDEVESISVGLWFNVGSRYEPQGLQGGAHFLEHMLFKGTRQRNALKISQDIESKGGDLNAFTSEEMTCYYARMGADHLDLVLDVLFDMLWNSSFPKLEVERERGVILEEIRMYEDQPTSLAMDRLNEALWKGNSLGLPVAGTPTSVGAIPRDKLMQFWKNHYHSQTTTVVLAGNFSEENVRKKLAPYLNKRVGPAATPTYSRMKPSRTRTLQVLPIVKPFQQSSLALGIRGYARKNPKCYAEKILSVLLGENMSSRLFQSLREQHGLAYSVQTSTNHFYDCGAFYLQLGVDTANILASMKLTGKELRRIIMKKPSLAELQGAKDYLIGQTKLSMESTSNRMMWLGESLVGLGYVEDLKISMAKIQAVTPEQVSLIAAELFQPGRMVLTCVGPDVTEKLLRSAGKELF